MSANEWVSAIFAAYAVALAVIFFAWWRGWLTPKVWVRWVIDPTSVRLSTGGVLTTAAPHGLQRGAVVVLS